MVTARCFWALIKFMVAYLLAFVITHLLARDMLMVSYIRPHLVKFLVVTFLFFVSDLLLVCVGSATWLISCNLHLFKGSCRGFW